MSARRDSYTQRSRQLPHFIFPVVHGAYGRIVGVLVAGSCHVYPSAALAAAILFISSATVRSAAADLIFSDSHSAL